MDILIKGLKMPTGDDDVKLIINSDGRVHRIIGWAVSEKMNAKAIELPPHGYLGDLSELSMTLYSELEAQAPKTLGEVMKIIKKVFDEAPTVLEAST